MTNYRGCSINITLLCTSDVTFVQDMLYVKNGLLELLGLKVKLPMVPEMGNQGVVYLASSWSLEDRTRHIDACLVFL
jgi:hypothetical protein